MRYGEIARRIREETNRLNALTDELERIEKATPRIDIIVEKGSKVVVDAAKHVFK